MNVFQSLRARRLTLNDCCKALLRISGTHVVRGNVTDNHSCPPRSSSLPVLHLQLELEHRIAEAIELPLSPSPGHLLGDREISSFLPLNKYFIILIFSYLC